VSGILGMFGRDGAPVDQPLLRSLAQFLSFRGPDAREVWAEGPIGFGHTLLRTTNESASERQPLTLDGRFTITADARIDCRKELLAALESAGRKVRSAAPDAELILHAYSAWSEECVAHLRGDFAFAIWDARWKTLFCARDHFGVKPFYYAELGQVFLFSNTLDCLRLHPQISEELNEAAIADFLLFGMNCDLTTSVYRHIRRLAPGHCLTVSAAAVRARRYWTAPVDGCIRYKRPDEYVEHFQELMRAAVADRLRMPRAGILLSGGLDSSSIAATAREFSDEAGGTTDLRAYTVTYDRLIPDRDGEYARQVAEFLGIPIRLLPLDGIGLFERWGDAELSWPEPVDDPFFAGLFDQQRMIAAECRVVLEGEGADNLMIFQILPYLRNLARKGEWRHALRQAVRFLSARPAIWPSIRNRIRALSGKRAGQPDFPRWLAPEFVRRMNLRERWNQVQGSWPAAASPHPIVPAAHASLMGPQWAHWNELQDPGVTRCAVEVRHPFLDLRIVDYILALPPFPWTFRKSLLRAAATGHIPESVRTRPKTLLAGDPLAEKLKQGDAGWVRRAQWSEQIGDYVRAAAVPELNGQRNPEETLSAIRPLCLNFWLQLKRGVAYNIYAEAHGG
jgi:asparagine synthase (glutamine-hydrolysing)